MIETWYYVYANNCFIQKVKQLGYAEMIKMRYANKGFITYIDIKEEDE